MQRHILLVHGDHVLLAQNEPHSDHRTCYQNGLEQKKCEWKIPLCHQAFTLLVVKADNNFEDLIGQQAQSHCH